MGSWIITFTFFSTGIYLIYEGKCYQALNLASAFGTSLILCFGGLLFTGVITYLVTLIGTELTNEILLGALVPVGVLFCLTIRHFFNKHLR